jgi:hypothetical protein
MVTYTNRLIPKGFAAITLGFVILIRPQYRGDAGLIAHERIHVQQWKESWGAFWPRYLLSKRWRRDYEVEAYQEQLRYSPECLDLFAGYLANNYRLGISVDIARALLTKP